MRLVVMILRPVLAFLLKLDFPYFSTHLVKYETVLLSTNKTYQLFEIVRMQW